jgi:hypothetical protein
MIMRCATNKSASPITVPTVPTANNKFKAADQKQQTIALHKTIDATNVQATIRSLFLRLTELFIHPTFATSLLPHVV